MRGLVRLAAAAIAIWVTWQLIGQFDLWGDPLFLGVAVLVLLPTLFLVVAWLLRREVPGSIHASAIWLASRPRIASWRTAHPQLTRRVLRRLANRQSGWPATLLTGVAMVAWLIGLGSVLQDVLVNDPAARADVRVLHLLATFRVPALGEPVRISAGVINPLALSVFGLLLAVALMERPLRAIPFLSPGAAALLAVLLGNFAPHSPLPDRFAVVAPVTGFPDPSLAAFAALLSTFLLVAWPRNWWSRALLISAAILTVGLGMLDLAALGAAWFTDLWGGTLLGAGTACLLAALARWLRIPRIPVPRTVTGLVVFLALLALLIAGGRAPAARTDFASPSRERTQLAASSVDDQIVARLPHWSETMTGRRIQPVSLILIGSRASLEDAFRRSGWNIALPITPASSWQIALNSLQGKPYETAPVSPDFLDGYPQDWAVERQTDARSVRARHHARFWTSGLTLADGTPIWVGNASLDTNIELAPNFKFPTHHIDPAVDLERDNVAAGLEQAGVERVREVQLVPPEAGSNAEGDLFFTYGKVIILRVARTST